MILYHFWRATLLIFLALASAAPAAAERLSERAANYGEGAYPGSCGIWVAPSDHVGSDLQYTYLNWTLGYLAAFNLWHSEAELDTFILAMREYCRHHPADTLAVAALMVMRLQEGSEPK